MAVKRNKVALGGIWLDDCRIPYENENDGLPLVMYKDKSKNLNYYREDGRATGDFVIENKNNTGRFPANLLVMDDILNDGTISKSSVFPDDFNGGIGNAKNSYDGRNNNKWRMKNTGGYSDSGSFSRYFNLDKWFEKI